MENDEISQEALQAYIPEGEPDPELELQDEN